MELYAEDVKNYWKTSKVSPDRWLEKAGELIESIDGAILGEAFGSDPVRGYAAYIFQFELDGQQFKIIWPVLPSRNGERLAARRQAATFIYHDVKARVMSAKVLGTRAAFFSYLLLSDGRTTTQASVEELMRGVPQLLQG